MVECVMEKLQAKFMEYIFIIQSLQTSQVVLEKGGFMIITSGYHTHFDYLTASDDPGFFRSELNRLRETLISCHEHNEEKIIHETHENLKRQGKDSTKFLMEPLSEHKTGKLLQMESQRNEYLVKINRIKTETF